MPHSELDPHARKLESRIAALEEMLAALEQTVVEQSEHLERNSDAQSRLAAIVESSGDGIISVAPDQTIASWNRGAEKLFGFSAAEAIGQPITMIIPAEQHQLAAEVMGQIAANPLQTVTFEAPNLRKDG